LRIVSVPAGAIAETWSGHGTIGWEGMIDGAPFVVERGAEGDHRFVHGTAPGRAGAPSSQTLAVHHLDSEARVLQCAPSNPEDTSWWRVVLDSVLFTVALLRGYEAMHAGALATPDGVIAIAAGTGGGKSTLLAELLGRGSALVADDVLVLEPRDTAPPIAHPGPPLMTVPAASRREVDATETAPIAEIGDELWIAVPTYSTPMRLKALVVLDRRPVSGCSLTQPLLSRIESPLVALLSALMDFPATQERRRARFELASALASTVGLWRLTARLETPADALADVLLAAAL
jgi:hypothetical protein